ncbi:proteasome subunit beta type [Striga asiatica]|uniref:Proteasome subunit beta type n=1 Tax=Striga asiatica TaxID=4170 RepID=A0A5A7PE67_STRAF|nr:proteasome subunit beta type [Striga asiatica]
MCRTKTKVFNVVGAPNSMDDVSVTTVICSDCRYDGGRRSCFTGADDVNCRRCIPLLDQSPPPPPPKRIRLDQSGSSSVNPFKTKVCLVFRCSGYDEPDKYFLEILVLDLLKDKDADIISGAGEEFKPVKPTFRLFPECFPADTSCVVGSTLYLFDGIFGGVYSRSEAHRSSVATVDLSQYTDDDFTLDLKAPALKISPHVLHPKCLPMAVPTSDGKILVFSRYIELDRKAVNVDFELFDPITCGSCRELPQLGLNEKRFRVLGYTLHEPTHTFFLQTEEGDFCLDLAGGERWARVDGLFGIRNLPCKGPLSITRDAEFCLTAAGIYDLKSKDTKCRLCSWFVFEHPPTFGPGFRAAAPLDHGDSGALHFCLLQTKLNTKRIYYETIDAQNESLTHPQLIIRVLHANLKKLRDAYESDSKTRSSHTTGLDILTSLKFVLSAHRYWSFLVENMCVSAEVWCDLNVWCDLRISYDNLLGVTNYIASLIKTDKAAFGYGSYFALSMMDRHYHKDMTVEEAIALVDEIRSRLVVAPPNFIIKIVDKDDGLGSTLGHYVQNALGSGNKCEKGEQEAIDFLDKKMKNDPAFSYEETGLGIKTLLLVMIPSNCLQIGSLLESSKQSSSPLWVLPGDVSFGKH